MQQDAEVLIRWLIRRDMDEVVKNERESFKFPWSSDEFVGVLRQRNVIGMVAASKSDERILGHMVYQLYRNYIVLLNFAVHPLERCRSVGTQMVSKLLKKVATQKRNRIELLIRETNLKSQIFFYNRGFRATGIIKEAFPCLNDQNEDGYRMIHKASWLEKPPYCPRNRITEYIESRGIV